MIYKALIAAAYIKMRTERTMGGGNVMLEDMTHPLGQNLLEMSPPALFTCIRGASAGRVPQSGCVLSMFRPASHLLDMLWPKEDDIVRDDLARALVPSEPVMISRLEQQHPSQTNM
ncbi:hypothetical protein FIBSPDRAFT_890013 [Athelia psychrophila]|uniref:Uncharacterized protein n=1 Tax=Athelia psychrophila TaxID=1759441 RepID=A0A166LFF4_9AGAM|nr:hypothetical protein FIBSPDRAFT_890013 [Fibularhizoctonia sp. CBS 109695]